MVGVPSPFGGSDTAFDAHDEFVPEHVPPPGEFLDGHDVLAGRDHLAVNRLARDLFEEQGVYDMTFGYNLARLNNDPRHPDAGYRYAIEDADAADADGAVDPDVPKGSGDGESDPTRVLRAEFTPTTAFCPQSDTLTRGTFRAWNGLAGRHEFDLVRVRVAPMHQRSVEINGELRQLEARFHGADEVPDGDTLADETAGDDPTGREGDSPDDPPAGDGRSTRGPTAPF
ncbi:MAG: hypothetical protein V5A44_06810 [Haloarculaceae archaeon]